LPATSMTAGSGPTPPPGTQAPGRFMASIRWPSVARYPYRRRIRIGTPAAAPVAEEIEATLRKLRFRVEVHPTPGAPPGTVSILAERNVVQVSMSLARALPLLTLIAAGVVLGIVDWLVTNQFIVVFPWIGAFAIAAFVFRLRIGGAYLSELIFVEVQPLPARAPSNAPSVGTVWGAGRARSEGEMGPEHERTVVKITPLIPLADVIAFVVQETSRHLARTGPPPTGQSM
jgi:hypothetical protein